METDLGDKDDPRGPPQQPRGYYEEELPPLERENTQHWYPPPSQPMMFMPPPQPEPVQKKDVFSDIDRTTYIIAFVVFILGFFMGKTMQPVILRNV
tara:strand:- start:16283 stop:16570 length:288 start_codon:yes stop_codon:yes gene_type:complete